MSKTSNDPKTQTENKEPQVQIGDSGPVSAGETGQIITASHRFAPYLVSLTSGFKEGTKCDGVMRQTLYAHQAVPKKGEPQEFYTELNALFGKYDCEWKMLSQILLIDNTTGGNWGTPNTNLFDQAKNATQHLVQEFQRRVLERAASGHATPGSSGPQRLSV